MTELMTRPETREHWLELAVLKLRPLFAEIDVELPNVRVSVGWPSRGGVGAKKKVIGQCWKTTVAGDNVSQIFISPVLGTANEADAIQLLGVLAHELIHAADDCESGHKGAFGKMARALGLAGKLTATVVDPDSELYRQLAVILDDLGPLPHAALNPFEMEKQRPKQGTRMLKLTCPNDGYTARTTRKWLDDLGAPKCPCGMELEEEEEK